jgi:hypothetical protein
LAVTLLALSTAGVAAVEAGVALVGVVAVVVVVVGVVIVGVGAACKTFNTFVNAANSRVMERLGADGTGFVPGTAVLGVVAPVASAVAAVLPGLTGVVPPKDWANCSSRCTKPL